MIDNTMQWVISKLVEKVHSNFFGSVTITFQAGKVHYIETKETEKPHS